MRASTRMGIRFTADCWIRFRRLQENFAKMIRFRIIHLLAVTAYASVFAALAPFGEMGLSIMPILIFPLLFLIPYGFKFSQCPDIFKARYHVGLAIFLSFLVLPSLLYEFGWWRLPFNLMFTALIGPAVLIIIQLIKIQSRNQPNIELRIAQIVAIWFPITMLAIARCFGKMMPLV